MATKRMLIDSTHPEETRVVVLNGTRLEDFDVEVASRKQLKGNIYLAKVTRVEPSLQAAFVDYGGNRHGFLSFNEIHPDYYQIPVTDRERILAEHSARTMEEESEIGPSGDGEGTAETGPSEDGEADESVEIIGGDDSDEVEDRRPNAFALRRQYKIQEVIKRRQILLVQVVKEERGNKGAALTTYLSLAGRYCVLMPNTARGGGISRKIAATADRKRLKSILGELELPDGMAVIVRTAGAERSKAEIKRDYEYLLRLWDNVRKLTLASIAPTLVYEEGNLIKRAVRDLYDRDIDEIVVDGEEGYRIAKDFMKLLIPSHVKRVKRYDEESMPLFHRYQVENQLDGMHSPTVQLRSGGYIVINPTEALVAIDVNSGRATRERNIEETAMRTNVEAAEEIARQLRLRDLAGLVVIDFIDMEMSRNRIQVERRLKDAMRTDRARIQLGRISPFGLLELSRQRLRPSLLETSFGVCPHCAGSGLVRSTDSAALQVLRAIEEEGIRRHCGSLAVLTPTPIALYLLNHKRAGLGDIEHRYGITIEIRTDDSLVSPNHLIEWTKPAVVVVPETEAIAANSATAAPAPEEQDEPEEEAEEAPAEERRTPAEAESSEEDGSRRRRRRRRPRRRREGEEAVSAPVTAAEPDQAAISDQEPAGEPAEGEPESGVVSEAAGEASQAEHEEDAERNRRRRRGKRGGRRRRGGRPEFEAQPLDGSALPEPATDQQAAVPAEVPAGPEFIENAPAEGVVTLEPAPAAEVEAASEVPTGELPAEAVAAPDAAEATPPRRSRRRRKPVPAELDAPEAVEPAPIEEAAAEEPAAARRRPRRRRPVRAAEDAAQPESIAVAQEAPIEAAVEVPVAAPVPVEMADLALAPAPVEAAAPFELEPAPAPAAPEPEPTQPRVEPVQVQPGPQPQPEPEEPHPADPLSDSIVHVGNDAVVEPQPKRRGWWQRLTDR